MDFLFFLLTFFTEYGKVYVDERSACLLSHLYYSRWISACSMCEIKDGPFSLVEIILRNQERKRNRHVKVND